MGASSACDCSGEADDEPALRSRSSRRLFIFLPDHWSVPIFEADLQSSVDGVTTLTVIALSDPVLYPSTLSQI